MAYTTVNDPSAHFQTALYTGNGTSTNAVTNSGNSNLKPDWLWLKSRSISSDQIAFDSTRGTNKRLSPNTTGAEETQAYYSSFNTDGFTIGSDNANVNQNSATYVNWQWKANGGTTSSNSDGTITSTVQANTTAGFSIITYSGNGYNNATVGHGLGATPKMIITKNRSATYNWITYNSKLAATKVLVMDMDLAEFTPSGGYYSNVGSSTYQLVQGSSNLTNVNASGNDYVAYCFAEKKGYSKFGSYTGTGNVDGPLVYCGFKPAWVMTKNSSHAGGWAVMDNARNPYNVMNKYLITNTADAEASGSSFDIDTLANGFKIRASNANINADGRTYIFMAFAQEPLVGTNNIASTAQ